MTPPGPPGRSRATAGTDAREPARSPEAPFGSSMFRDRFTDAVWQGPTWSFAIVLLALDVTRVPSGGHRLLLLAGFGLIMLVTLVALFVRWEKLPAWTQVTLPVGDLLGSAMMVLAVPAVDAPTTFLLCSLPAIWLAFEFGRGGLVAAVAVVALLGCAAYVRGVEPDPAPRPDSIMVPVLFVLGLAVVARLMSMRLHRVGEVLQSQAAQLLEAVDVAEARLVVTTGVMESIDAGVVVLRPGEETLHNDKAAALADRAGALAGSPEVPGDRVYESDGTTAVPAGEQAALRAVAGDEFTGVVHWLGAPGDQVAVATSARLLVRPDGEVLGSVMASWDATELMNAIRVREDFVTTVSHELRTPLTAVAASLELLEDLLSGAGVDSGLDADCQPLLSSALRNSALLDARISELLASTTAADNVYRARPTDVSGLVRAALVKHEAAAQEAGLTLGVELEAGVVAEVDPTRFEQVVDNLLSNAIKYTPAGDVTVSLERTGPHLALSVADSGVGMTADEQRQAFDRFYRAPKVKATAIQGLGIGLGLVKTIVERHHGSIVISSRPGVGSTVTVTVPIGS